jgi:hypothetical protein
MDTLIRIRSIDYCWDALFVYRYPYVNTGVGRWMSGGFEYRKKKDQPSRLQLEAVFEKVREYE